MKQLLQQSLKDANQSEVRLLVHRLAGRVSQIGAKDLGMKFRVLEQNVANADLIDTAIEVDISVKLEELNELIHKVDLYIDSLT